ncbi:MAG: anthrone oxygenase family protein [Pseudomonadota bacterium]
MEWIQLAVLISALLCSLVTGLVLCFAIIVMPGIKTLGTVEFLKSFKAMDGIIQKNPPLFMVVWLGSTLAILLSTLLGFWQLQGLDMGLLIFACITYIFGVHLPTITTNVPLNNRLQSVDLDATTPPELRAILHLFETRWLYWNTVRTVVATLTTLTLLVLLLRI